ncbi:hypothetical protein KEM55_007469, partial [Ascosphaera atra]
MSDQSGSTHKRPAADDQSSAAQKRPRPDEKSNAQQRGGKGSPDPEAVARMVAEARARAEAMAQAAKARAAGATPPVAASPAATPAAASPAMSRLEQMKARVAAATGRAASAAPQRPSAPSPAPFVPPPPPQEDVPNKARGGLDVGLHPALLADLQEMRSRTASPKYATTKANRRTSSPMLSKPTTPKTPLDVSGPSLEEVKANPYYDPNLGVKTALPKPRVPRQLVFNQKGKYITQAVAMRRQAQLEEMKRRIAERSRQAGLDEDIDLEKAFL